MRLIQAFKFVMQTKTTLTFGTSSFVLTLLPYRTKVHVRTSDVCFLNQGEYYTFFLIRLQKWRADRNFLIITKASIKTSELPLKDRKFFIKAA